MTTSSRDIDFPDKDQPLRDDVRLLGAMVGDMLREQGGEDFFQRVEAVRNAAIRRREDGSARDMQAELGRLEPFEARELVRAFSTYFQMVNLAERVHRIRRRRDYERVTEPQPEGFADSVARLRDAGIDDAAICEAVSKLVIEPVFTAHPTEAMRRTLLEKQQRVAEVMIRRFVEDMTPREEGVALAQLREEITAAWQTEEHSAARMTVANERDNLLYFLGSVIYRALPVFLEQIERQLDGLPGSLVPDRLLRFGSWIGGDMDGNPNVNHETILDSLTTHRALIVHRYRGELKNLYRLLSQSHSRINVDTAITERIREYAAMHPVEHESISHRHRNMPYRVLLRLMSARLRANAEDRAGGYENAQAFAEDLEKIHASLRLNQGEHAGLFLVKRLLRRVRAFGFHLAALDVRQDSLVFRRSLGALMNDADWLELDSVARAKRIREAWRDEGKPAATAQDEAANTLRVFNAINESRRRFGDDAVGDVVISMAEAADDVLGVLLLARWAGLHDEAGGVPLDVVPLFETVGDLENSTAVMTKLFDDPVYREHLAARGNVQRVMLGYSDSAKDGGVAASRWALQQAQSQLVSVARTAGVTLTFFHGRGGTVSRGGGRVHRAVLAAPPGTVNGVLRVTEQGEIINAKYGLRGIAMRTFEQMAGAMLIADLAPAPSHEDAPEWTAAMERVSNESRRCFRELVYENESFYDFFRTVTPVDVIERMKIGSRPAARRKGKGIGDLRAIPWVFAWTQNRCILPAWYGLGTGLNALVEHAGLDSVQHMARAWPFFANLLDDVEMVIAKTDMDIADRYFALHDDPSGIGAKISAEHALTVKMLLAARNADTLLADDPGLERAIRLRNPYVDPMSLLQVELLGEWREAGSKDDEHLNALIATVNGIAQGLQNTG
ncbi:MAG TPA: phosphoenolpyruvate carboxylase [Gammaproteobacteria bacterium]